VVRTASNVIDRINRRSWGDLGRDEAGRAATSLMVGLEENAFLLADSVTKETILVKPTDNIRELNYLIRFARHVF
jgi:latrophilin 1